MYADAVDENEIKSSQETWKGEIAEWLERLKMTEKCLRLREKELREREMILRQREKKLEEQFNVVVSVLACSAVALHIIILMILI